MKRRIVIVGSSCSGKTTAAKSVAEALGLKHIEIDDIFWKSGWVESTYGDLFPKIEKAVSDDQWVVDGNYGRLRQVIWPRATEVIWLDYPLRIILTRFLCRSISRHFSKDLLWGKCKESLRSSIFSKNSLLVWILTQYKKLNSQYETGMQDPQYNHIKFQRFFHPRQFDQFLTELDNVKY